ncbi:MAG: alpha/beta hydrolase [Deltaproteobacteria bacterium]|nr:alpha/beta hydrolase [Deltaproteobacteria bacterium]
MMEKEFVILLHGMGRTRHSMRTLARHLKKAGYTTINDGYPSTAKTVSVIAETDLAPMVDKCKKTGAEKIHIVTHSLGGIVVRRYLQGHSLPEGSRIVMISPPNHGSEIADVLRHIPLYRWIYGPAGAELGTGPDSVPNRLAPVDAEIGIITGDRSLNPLFSRMLAGKNDGKVSVASARLDEMIDFTVVHSTHCFIMQNKTVLKKTAAFLKTGKFALKSP